LGSFQFENEALAATEYCREWNDERLWLRRNEVDYKGFPEERKFQALASKHRLFERANNAKLSRAIKYVTEQRAGQKQR
jgi:hypothetical protein